MKRMFCILMIAAMVLALAGCAEPVISQQSSQTNPVSRSEGPSEVEKTIKFALMAPMTGNYALHGEAYETVIGMAVDEYNAVGGYQGKMVEVLVYDDKCDAKEGVSVAQLIVNEPGVVVCLGPWSSTVAFAVEPIMTKAKIPLYAISSSHADFTKASEYCIRGPYLQTQCQQIQADNTYHILGLRKAAYLYDSNNESAATAAQLFKEYYEELGGEVVSLDGYAAGTMDFSAQIAKYKQQGVDSLQIMGSYTETAAFVNQVRAHDMDCIIIISGMALQPELSELIAGNRDILVIDFFDKSLPFEGVQEFCEEYKRRAGKEVTSHGYGAYCAVQNVFSAMEAVGLDGTEMARYMRNNKDLPVLLGTLSLTDGDPNHTLFFLEFNGTEFVYSETYNDPDLFSEIAS